MHEEITRAFFEPYFVCSLNVLNISDICRVRGEVCNAYSV